MYQPDLFDQLHSDAKEKALEYDLQTFKESQKLKFSLIQQGKLKINKQFDELIKHQKAKHRIMKSASINYYRMKKANLKFQLSKQIFAQVQNKIKIKIRQNPKCYQLILITFIVEGLIRMFEQKCQIKCLSQDCTLIQQILQDSKFTYNYVMQQQIGRQYNLDLSIIKNDPMKQRDLSKNETFLQKKRQDYECIGGIILRDESGNIMYKNTIDARINILKEICLPQIRMMLWGHRQIQK